MQHPHHTFDRLIIFIVVAAISIGVSYLEMSHKQLLKPIGHSPAPAISRPVAAPAPVVKKTAITTTLVHFRSQKDVNSKIITDLQPGTVVQLRDDSDGTWQGVSYNGQDGFIFKSYLQNQ
jgi:hypothetical protein